MPRLTPITSLTLFALLALLCLLTFSTTTRAAKTLEFRITPNPYLDLSWNLPNAVLQQNNSDYSLFLAKARTYTTCDTLAEAELPPAATFRAAVERALLDSPEKRDAYYTQRGLALGNASKDTAARVLTKRYRNVGLAVRQTMARHLSAAYAALLRCDAERYTRQVSALNRLLVTKGIVARQVKRTPLAQLEQELKAAQRMGLGEYLNQPIEAARPNCKAFGSPAFTFPFRRLVLDPGHFGGEGVADSREYRGYREGRATFIVAHLAKFYLMKCFDVNPAAVVLTRDNLHNLYGNAYITFYNFSLMDYRTELLAFLEPDAVISIHTDAGLQRIKSFYPQSSAVYYIYRNRGLMSPPADTITQSAAFNRALITGLAQTMGGSNSAPEGDDVFRWGAPPQVMQGRSKVFQNVLERQIPVALLEGFSHENDAVVALLTKPENRSETVAIAGRQYRYSPLLQRYARGIVCGIIQYELPGHHCQSDVTQHTFLLQ